jgi:hypothetical protein
MDEQSALDLLGGFDNYQYAANVVVRDRLSHLTREQMGFLESVFQQNASVKISLRDILNGESAIWTSSDLKVLTCHLGFSQNVPLIPANRLVEKMSGEQREYWLRKMYRGKLPLLPPFDPKDPTLIPPIEPHTLSVYNYNLEGYLMIEALDEIYKIAKERRARVSQ